MSVWDICHLSNLRVASVAVLCALKVRVVAENCANMFVQVVNMQAAPDQSMAALIEPAGKIDAKSNKAGLVAIVDQVLDKLVAEGRRSKVRGCPRSDSIWLWRVGNDSSQAGLSL